jgi:hypothetical protein
VGQFVSENGAHCIFIIIIIVIIITTIIINTIIIIIIISGLETENTSVGIGHADHVATFLRKSWH